MKQSPKLDLALATDDGPISRAMTTIRDQMSEPIDIVALCVGAAMSRSHFSRSFKKTTGMTPGKYQHEVRIEKSKFMLSRGAQQISAIAILCGFSSQPHFNRSFKVSTGITPKEYRRGEAPTKRQLCPQLLVCWRTWNGSDAPCPVTDLKVGS